VSPTRSDAVGFGDTAPKSTTRSRPASQAIPGDCRGDGPMSCRWRQCSPLSRTVTCRAASYTTLEVNQGAWGPSSSICVQASPSHCHVSKSRRPPRCRRRGPRRSGLSRR
jgi:hypothetical protein